MAINDRYQRQELFFSIGHLGQDKLISSRVAIVGMGALGSALANQLARAGVGFIRLIDRDIVEYRNLHRDSLYDEADAKAAFPKAIAAKLKLDAINSLIQVDAHIADLTWKNAEDLLTDVDLILDGTDNFEARYLLNDVSLKHNIPWIYGEAIGALGKTASFIPHKTPCFCCIFNEVAKSGSTETSATAGVIGPIVQVVAAYQATEALKILLHDWDSLSYSLKSLDMWLNQSKESKLINAKDDKCLACASNHYAYLEPKNKQERFVELCGNDTVQISPKPDTVFNLDQLAKRLSPLGKVEQTPYLIRFYIDAYDLTIFTDGRILVHGTDEPVIAKNLYTSYIGN